MRVISRKITSIKMVGIVLFSLLCLFAFSASAEGKKCGLFTYELNGNGTAKITDYDWENHHEADDLYIPEMLDGYTVTVIGEEAFAFGYDYSWPYKVKIAVIIPDTVTSINDRAFFYTSRPIASVAIPASVKSIGEGAFAGGFVEDEITDRVKVFVAEDNEVYTILNGALYNKIKKELVYAFERENDTFIVPEGILSIGDYAFYGFDYDDPLEVSLPSTLTKIGDSAFDGCYISAKNSNGYFRFPDSLVEIGRFAFANTKSEESIIFDLSNAKITEMPQYAFYRAGSRKYWSVGASWQFLLPDTVEVIKDGAFEHCYKGYINMPANLKMIERKAFSECESEISGLPEGLQSIGEKAFYKSNLSNPELPKSLESIGAYAFESTDINSLKIPESVEYLGEGFCDRTAVTLEVVPGSYAALWASENGYSFTSKAEQDTSWLNN